MFICMFYTYKKLLSLIYLEQSIVGYHTLQVYQDIPSSAQLLQAHFHFISLNSVESTKPCSLVSGLLLPHFQPFVFRGPFNMKVKTKNLLL